MARARIAAALVPALLGLGCDPPGPGMAKPPAPARLERPSKESELATVILTKEAAARLDIPSHLAEARRARMPRTRLLGGEIVAVPGRSATVVAPFAGTVEPARGEALPRPGMTVKRGQVLLALRPLLSPSERLQVVTALADAEGQVARAQVQLDAAVLVLRRVEQLIRDRATSVRALEDARAQHDTAKATLEAAKARRDSFAGVSPRTNAGADGPLDPVPIASPIQGLVRDVRCASGLDVVAGAPLVDVVDLTTVWVKVPVPVAELSEIDPAKPCSVSGLVASVGSSAAAAVPVRPQPPSASPVPGTVELFYELTNQVRALVPGERVGVTLTLEGDEESLVIPWSAVLHDAYGGTWVYERTGPETFQRRRVVVRRVAGDLAVLAPVRSGAQAALGEGARIVTAGAVELLGTELGAGK